MRAESAHQRIRRRVMAGLGGLLAIGASSVRPQQTSPAVTLIVPRGAGASADRLGRIVADGLAEILEGPVRVENIAGDAGVPGTNAIAAGAKDGSVLGVAISSAIIGGRLLSRSAKFNPIDDFEWLTILGTFPNALVISAQIAVSEHRKLARGGARYGVAVGLRESRIRLRRSSRGGLPAPRAGSKARPSRRGFERGPLRAARGRQDRRSLRGRAQRGDAGSATAFPNPRSDLQRAPRVVAHGAVVRRVVGTVVRRMDRLVAPRGLDTSAYHRLASVVGVLVSDPRHADKLRAAGLTFMGLSGRGTVAFLETDFLRNAKLIATLNEEGQRKMKGEA